MDTWNRFWLLLEYHPKNYRYPLKPTRSNAAIFTEDRGTSLLKYDLAKKMELLIANPNSLYNSIDDGLNFFN